MDSSEDKFKSPEWTLKEPSDNINLRESEDNDAELHVPAQVIRADQPSLKEFEKPSSAEPTKDVPQKKSIGAFGKAEQSEPNIDGKRTTGNFNWSLALIRCLYPLLSIFLLGIFLTAWHLHYLHPLSFVALSVVPYFLLLAGVFLAKHLTFDQLWFKNRKRFAGRRAANTLLAIMLIFAPTYAACLYLEAKTSEEADAGFANNRYAEACELYGRLAELMNVSYFIMRQGECLIEMREFQKATDLYSAAILHEPSLELYSARAKALERLHKNNLAQKDKESANKIQKQLGDAASAQILFDNRQFEDALINYNKMVALQPKLAKNYVLRAKCLYQLKKYPEAIADCTRAISLNPKFGQAFYERSMAYDQLGKSELAKNDRTDARLFGYRRYSLRSPD